MPPSAYAPVFEIVRGETVESRHWGAVAVVEASGRLVAWHGDPQAVTFMRSSAKPFQALPLVEAGGQQRFGFTPQEIALICASHSGTDEHVAVARGIQEKAGLDEGLLLCGVHPPHHEPTLRAMQARGQEATPNRNNCSGKHSGMLALARLKGWPVEDYIDPAHPVQRAILQAFAEMCDLPPAEVARGTDGCSAPNFAVPLANAALAFARLADPSGLPEGRAAACRTICAAMRAHPQMVGGPGRFDTRLMEAAGDRLVCKGGAEAYQGIGLLPGALGPASPALGVALKIADGDGRKRAGPAVALEVLRQLGALSSADLETLAGGSPGFGPELEFHNYRGLLVSRGRPCFTLERN